MNLLPITLHLLHMFISDDWHYRFSLLSTLTSEKISIENIRSCVSIKYIEFVLSLNTRSCASKIFDFQASSSSLSLERNPESHLAWHEVIWTRNIYNFFIFEELFGFANFSFIMVIYRVAVPVVALPYCSRRAEMF